MSVYRLATVFAICALMAFLRNASAAEAESKTESWKPVILEHLNKQYPGKTWDVGPVPVDSPEIRRAYGGLRFYMVLSHQPLTPRSGIPWPADHPILEAYRAEMQTFQKAKLSLIMAMDANGSVREYREPRDFARGLMKAAQPEDFKIATAAVLTLLIRDEFGYVPVNAKDVTLFPLGSTSVSHAQVVQGNMVGVISFGPQGDFQSCSRIPRTIPG